MLTSEFLCHGLRHANHTGLDIALFRFWTDLRGYLSCGVVTLTRVTNLTHDGGDVDDPSSLLPHHAPHKSWLAFTQWVMENNHRRSVTSLGTVEVTVEIDIDHVREVTWLHHHRQHVLRQVIETLSLIEIITRVMPALLTSMSTGPTSSLALANICCTYLRTCHK